MSRRPAKHFDLKYFIAKELVVMALCIAAAFYLRSILTFTPAVDQTFWALKAALGLYLVYHILGFFIAALKTLIGIAILLIAVLGVGLLISMYSHPKAPSLAGGAPDEKSQVGSRYDQ